MNGNDPCAKFQAAIDALMKKVAKIQKSPGYIQDKNGPHPGKPDPDKLQAVKDLLDAVKSESNKLWACLQKITPILPVTIAAESIHCINGTSELTDDEPYLIVVAIDLTVKPVPNLEATLYGPYADIASGDSAETGLIPFWWIDNMSAHKISKPQDVIIVAALMENDDGHPQAARGLAKSAAVASLASGFNLPRDVLVGKIIDDMNSALQVPTGAPNFDDQIGKPQELVLSMRDLVLASREGSAHLGLRFASDGLYEVNFVVRAM